MLFFVPRLVLRLFFPKLLDRYIMGELVPPLIFGWVLFIILWVMSIELFKLASLVARGARLDAVGQILGLRIILSSSYCLPMAMLLAGLLAFGRLSGDSELIAMQAAGVRNIRTIWNAFLLGLALSFIGLALNEYLIPPAGRALRYAEETLKAELAGKLAEELSEQRAFVVQDMEKGELSRVVVARRYEPQQYGRPATMHDVTYMQYDTARGDQQVQAIIEAARAEYIGEDKGHPGTRVWKFFQCKTQMMAGYTAQGQKWVMASDDQTLTLNKTPQALVRDQKNATDMTYREIKKYIREMRTKGVGGRPLRELDVEAERKLSIPFAALVLGLIGAPLGIRKQRTTAGVGIGLSLLIIVIYYACMAMLNVMGQNGQVSPAVSAWGANAVGLLVGLYLTLRSG